MPSQTGGPSFASPPRTQPRWTDWANCSKGTIGAARADHRGIHRPGRGHRQGDRRTPDHREDPRRPSANESMTAFAVASCAASCFPRSGTSPSTCLPRTYSFRCRGCSVQRQEEAQRLGRILRPKADGRAAHFFTLVSRDICEDEFAHHRKLFLAEQGYSYQVVIAGEP